MSDKTIEALLKSRRLDEASKIGIATAEHKRQITGQPSFLKAKKTKAEIAKERQEVINEQHVRLREEFLERDRKRKRRERERARRAKKR